MRTNNRGAFVSRRTFLPFSPPSIGEDEIAAVVEALRSDWLTTGPRTGAFESAFAAWHNLPAQGALALNSCTGGLHVALATLGIGQGDEVILPPLTFASVANVVEQMGATPILADVDPATLTLDPAATAQAITPRTRAIIPVHYAGHPAEMDAFRTLAQNHNLRLIEDAAHALSAEYRRQKIGTIGDFTAFSFYPTKNITTSEGGMLTGAPDQIAAARLWSLHGLDRDAWKRYSNEGSWYYEVVVPGFKYNMTDIQAALGLAQLNRLAEFQERRRVVAGRYNAAFTNHPSLEPPTVRDYVVPSWHLYVLRLNLETLRIDRAQVMEELKARNIGASVHFIPVHLHPYYRDRYRWAADAFPIAYREYQRMVSLPLFPKMTDADVEDVIAAVFDVVERIRR